jgi:hypothetical protein
LRPSAGPDPWPRPRLRIAADGPAMGAGRGPNGNGCRTRAKWTSVGGPGKAPRVRQNGPDLCFSWAGLVPIMAALSGAPWGGREHEGGHALLAPRSLFVAGPPRLWAGPP